MIYRHVPDARVIYLITVYGKKQKDDLSLHDKTLHRQLAHVLKQQARRAPRS